MKLIERLLRRWRRNAHPRVLLIVASDALRSEVPDYVDVVVVDRSAWAHHVLLR